MFRRDGIEFFMFYQNKPRLRHRHTVKRRKASTHALYCRVHILCSYRAYRRRTIVGTTGQGWACAYLHVPPDDEPFSLGVAELKEFVSDGLH